jgi:hypothetical protein
MDFDVFAVHQHCLKFFLPSLQTAAISADAPFSMLYS